MTNEKTDKPYLSTTPLVRLMKDKTDISRVTVDGKDALRRFSEELIAVFCNTIAEQAKTSHPKRAGIDMFDVKVAYDFIVNKINT